MNLIDTLRRMATDAETGRWAAREPSTDVEDREAIETVWAMQEALDGMCDILESVCGTHGWVPEHMSQYRKAKDLRRAEGNAG